MATSKPGLRTFAKKRKETAEDKYDAIFGPKSTFLTSPSAVSQPEDKCAHSKRRRQMHGVVNSPKKKNTSNHSVGTRHRETAAEKFDAIFGTRSETNGKSETPAPSQKKVIISPNSDEEDAVELSNVESRLGHDPSEFNNGEGANRSKYDLLFEENEKLASDKFDALFSESKHISNSKKITHKKFHEIKQRQNQVLNDLFKFNNWEDTPAKSESSTDASQSQSPTKPLTPTKLPDITHASMLKVGGRVVLNIQRGGNSNSLIEKGGTMLLSIDSKTKLPADVKPVATVICDKSPSDAKSNKLESSGLLSNKLESSELGRQQNAAEMQRELQSHPTPAKLKDEKISTLQPSKVSTSRTKKVLTYAGKKVSKSNASYNPRPWAMKSKEMLPQSDPDFSSLPQPTRPSSQEMSVNPLKSDEVPALKRAVTWPKNVGDSIVTSLKCDKNHEAYFTVVRHVKNYQNCLEEGEIKEFEDEVTYLQEGLHPNQPISVRCLSVTSLACKCEQQNFRLYLRAHNVLIEIFDSLQNADENKALSLATASLLYMLSRDRQIDINKSTLRILLKLVDPLDKAKSSEPTKEHETDQKKTDKAKNVAKADVEQESDAVLGKVKELIDRCGDPLVTSEDLSAKVLASEALLRFTARRTSEWYREEIRLKGGLDHIIGLVKTQVDIVEGHPQRLGCERPLAVERPLHTLERLLRVLENGIMNSPRNAMYLVTHQRALLLKKLSLLLRKCGTWLDCTDGCTSGKSVNDGASLLIKNVITQVIKLLVNISNDNEWSSSRIGEQDGLLYSLLCCILHVPDHVNEDHKYEIVLLGLGLMVNLIESSAKNRMSLMQMRTPIRSTDSKKKTGSKEEEISAVEALIKLFIEREASARQNEILGEDGVKKAVEAEKSRGIYSGDSGNGTKPARHDVPLGDAESGGYWVENDEGMEWVSVEGNRHDDETADDALANQGPLRSVDPRNPEARLTAEQKNEMKQALEKANDHMEASIVASYAGLILGCLIHGSRSNAAAIRSKLPDNGELSPMIRMLKKFLSFMKLTHGMSKKGEQKLVQIIEDMEEVNREKFSS